MLRFDGRVALVTGAGGGLGKEYALLLAARGAKVVVNDLGGGVRGGGKSSQLADEVVATIRSSGGVAVPNYDSVEEGEKLVKTAIDNFGRIDILINNAGILRDRSILNMPVEDFDIIQRVHLRGSFLVTKAAFAHMKKQKYGRIIMTSSPNGLYGAFGQTNYSSAKAGLVGLGKTVSQEGSRYNICCNIVAPSAWSRLSKDVMPPEMEQLIPASDVGPMVVYMCHESCEDTGTILETLGGWAAKTQYYQSKGTILKRPIMLEDVRDNWEEICDMSEPQPVAKYSEVFANLMPKLKTINQPETGEETIVGKTMPSVPYVFTNRDVILYALGIGCTVSTQDYSNLCFLYENHPDFSTIPSYAVLPAMNSVMNTALQGGIPGVKAFSLAQALHGEQYVELMRPMPIEGKVYSEGRVVDVLDKKSGASIIVEAETKTEEGELICRNQFVIFIIGVGGFGGKRSSENLKPILKPPSRAPDATAREKTTTTQAALYRLSGDYNPLHIDPEFSQLGGFKDPILHGMCSFGIATRHIMRQFCSDDTSKVKAIKARFSKPVLPGNTVQTDMWKEGNRIHFICKVVETGNECLSGGYLDLHEGATPSSSSSSSSGVPPDTATLGQLQSTAIFNELKRLVTPDIVKKVQAIYQWNITKEGKTVAQWTTDLKTPTGGVYPGEPTGVKPGCTLTISDDDLVKLVSGQLDAQKAFFQGKLKLDGNIMLSQKLEALFKAAKAKL